VALKMSLSGSSSANQLKSSSGTVTTGATQNNNPPTVFEQQREELVREIALVSDKTSVRPAHTYNTFHLPSREEKSQYGQNTITLAFSLPKQSIELRMEYQLTNSGDNREWSPFFKTSIA
jgi:hypothetical protein